MEENIMFLSFLKNRIIKNIISILLIIILLFNIIAPQLIIDSYSIPSKNIKQEEYFEEYFSFKVRDRDVSIKADLLQFQSIGVPIYRPEFLIGIVNVDYDNDPISKTIARCSFLGMDSDEIINEIKNKHISRIKTMEINEYGKKRIVNTYEYSPNKNNKIIAILDDLFIQREAKGGIAVILPVVSSTIKNETIIHNAFILKSKCINDNTENLGKICIDYENLTLPNSINLLKNKEYQIRYYPNEGYEFDHWEIYGGKLVYQSNSSRNILFIQNDYGEIIAYYRKIGISSTSTSTSITLMTSTLKTSSSSSSKTTQQSSTKSTYTTSIRTQSTTSTKEETKIKTTITISQSTLTYSISKSTVETYKVIKEDEYKAKYESYNTYTSINTISKTTYNTTSTIKKDKNIFDIISNIGKSILEGTKDIIDKTINVVNDFVKKALDFINNINPFKGNTTITSSTTITNTIKSSTTSSINTKTSNTITTISNYKYVITKTIITSTTSINTKTSTSYDIDKHIINNLNYYNSVNNVIKTTNTIYYTVKGSFVTYTTALYTYTTTKKITSSIKTSNTISGGGGSPKALLRDSLLLYPNVYKEFLNKVNRIENKEEIPLLYLVYKITPLRVEQYPRYEKGIITNEPYGFFLIKPDIPYYKYSLYSILENGKYSYEADIRSEIEIELEAGETKNEEIQIFFFEDNYYPSSLDLFIKEGKRLIDREPEYREYGIISQFWKGFFNAIRDKSPSIAIQIGLISTISLTTGGTGAIATVNSMLLATAFLLKLQSATIEAINIYEAYTNINTLNDIINKYEYLSNIAKEKKLNDTYNYLKEEENIKRNEILRILGNLGLDLFLNIDFNKFSIAIGIEKAKNEYEKGYATGETIASIINIFSFIAIQASISKLNNYLNKGSLWNVIKDSLKAWISPNIQDLAIIAKNKIKDIPSEKINNLLEKIAIIGLIFKSDIAQERIKKDLDPLLKDLTEEKIKKNPFLIDEAINKIDKYCSLLSIAEIGEGRGKDFIGNILKLSGDVYGITGDLEFTKDTFEALKDFPRKGEIKEYGYYEDPVKIAYDYLSDKDNVIAIKNGWNVLGENDYEKLFKIFIDWETALHKDNREKLNDVFNDYLNSKNRKKINILSNTLDFTYDIRKHIDHDKHRALFEHMIKFLNNWNSRYIENLLNDENLGKINSIISNFRKVKDIDAILTHKRFIHINYLFDHVFTKDKYGNTIIDKDLFNDWINKVLITSSSKDEFPEFILSGEEEYYTCISKDVAGKDVKFVNLKVPIKIDGKKTNGYIPLIISKEGQTAIPDNAIDFLKDIKYIPADRGFIIISTSNEGGKIFAPVNVESRYRADILRWTKKALAVSSLSEYVELKEGELIVDWKRLIKDELALEVTAIKPDGTIIAKRYVLFNPDQERIRIGLGSENCEEKGVYLGSTVLVIFDFKKVDKIENEIINNIWNKYKSVRELTEDDVTKAKDEKLKGRLGEYRICQIILKIAPEAIKDTQVEYKGSYFDIETTKHLIEVKYWSDESAKKNTYINELINQLKDYKDAIMNEKQGKKVILAFYKKLSEGAYNKVIEEINNNFEDWKNWLIICNGNYEFEEFITNEYKY
jgi:hypothetical protein